MSEETPIAAPESTPRADETAPREEETPLSPVDAWSRLLECLARLPQDDTTRALASVARASIREATEQPPITRQTMMAFTFMERLGMILAVMEQRREQSVAAVMEALFSARPPPPPNGAF